MKWLEIEMETVSLGAVALPNVLFMTYFMQHSRRAVAALPVIMFYVMVKTVPYALRSFGKVQNPLRLLRCSLVVALLGALLAAGTPLVVEGAILVGMGLASVQPAYQQTKDHFKQTGAWPAYARDGKLAGHARFTRQYYNILGSIISQVTLISLLVVCNYLFNRHTNQLLAAYYQHRAVSGLNDPLWLSRVGCLLFLLGLLAVVVSQQLRQVDKIEEFC